MACMHVYAGRLGGVGKREFFTEINLVHFRLVCVCGGHLYSQSLALSLFLSLSSLIVRYTMTIITPALGIPADNASLE